MRPHPARRLPGRAAAALLLAGMAAPAWAQEVASPVSAPAAAPVPNEAVTILIRQAERWLSQNRPDLASSSIERALAAEPNNTQALLTASRIEAARNNRDASASYLQRLQAAGGTDAQRVAADVALRAATLDRSALDEARRLSAAGRTDDAAAKYRALFGPAGPTPDLAREYYQALAASAATRAEGVQGLGQLAGAPNADAATLLANAETLTYQESTRVDGINRLASLADRPDTAAAARRSWRQALGFAANDPTAAPLIEAYLRRFPDDTELSQRLAALRRAATAAPAASPGDDLRRQGFAQLEAGSLRDSASRFEAALAVNPNDADALGGLGLVRLRDNRPADAQTLLERAIAADPVHAAQWQRALDGASYGNELTQARTLLRRNDPAGADTVLRSALRRDVADHTDAESMLGEVALRQGDAAGAEQHFRTALSRRPGFLPAVNGLNQALRAQNRVAEPPAPRAATTLADTGSAATSLATPSAGQQSSGQQSSNQQSTGQVGLLREEAARSNDVNVAVALLRNAVATSPSDPWARLDLARALRRQGRGADGRALVEELAARSSTPDASYAAALYAQEDGRLDDADAALATIAPTRRTADMARLQTRLRTDRDVSHAASALSAGGGGRDQMMMLAARPDPSGSTAAAVIRAFGDAGDRGAATEAARVAQAANRTAGPGLRLAVAGALLAAGADTEAGAIADQLSQTSVSPDQQRDLASLRTGIAIRASDRLNEGGSQAQAFERLRPVLAQDPDSTDAQLALARLYQGAQKPAEALRIAQTVLARDPHNMDARRGAVEAAIALNDRRTATTLIADAQAIGPSDSRVVYLQARVVRAFGNEQAAQALFQQALTLRQAELGTSATIASTSLDNPFKPANAPISLAALPQDPVSREITQALVVAQAESASHLSFAPSIRTRSGSPGLDQLSEISGTFEGTAAAPGIGGQITARAMPVTLSAGQLSSNTQTLYRFGSNPLLGTSPVVPKNITAAGVGLELAYALGDNFKLNAGTSPLGFHSPNLLGGFEFSTRLTDRLRLRISGDRHAVTDSLLSWAGLVDPVSGRTWGAVTSTGGHAQLEMPVGPGYVYAGGGYALYNGLSVARNNRTEAGAGFSYPVLKQADSELSAGLDLVYFGFDNNQRAFTLGNGGYFSPQTYGAINIPVDYRAKSGDLSYHLGATLGYATFNEKSSPVFPHDPGLQAQLVAAAATNPLLLTHNPALTRNGVVGGVRVDLDYLLTPTLTLSGSIHYDKAPDFDETRAVVRLQNRF